MERILLIDDDKNVRDSLTLTLESAGYSVTNVSNTLDGLHQHQEAPASVVITDVITLEHCGLESIRELRQQSPYPFPLLPFLELFTPVTKMRSNLIERLTQSVPCRSRLPLMNLLSTVKTVLPHSYV